jgi:hypothetical protein
MDEQQKPAFDPTRHLTKVSGRDYLEVKWRLVWFQDIHPSGSIVTELVQHQNSTAVFRASVSWDTGDGIATRTGYGMESSDNFGDYLEKAETKAIGRALGAAGFGTQFCDDFAFGADQQRVVDSPTNIRSGRTQARQTTETRRYAHAADNAPQDAPQAATAPRQMNPANADEPATQPQIKAIFAIGRKLDIDVKPWVHEQFGGRDIDSLTRAEASLIIEDWQEQVNAGAVQ